MSNTIGRQNAVIALLLIASLAIACSGLKNLGKNKTDEANKLVKSAQEDLAEVDKISDENDDKVRELGKAEDAGDADEVRRILKESIDALDRGLDRGRNAAKKIEDASKLDIDPVFKDYLKVKAEAFKKQVEAFEALRDAAKIERDNYGKGGDAEEAAQKDFRKKQDEYKKKINEAKDLHRKADRIARDNPNKIKT